MPTATPNYLTTKSDGATGAVFPGGIELLVTDGGTPPGERRITWIDEGTGLVASEEHVEEDSSFPGQHSHYINVGGNNQDPSVFSEIQEFVVNCDNAFPGFGTRLVLAQRAVLDPDPEASSFSVVTQQAGATIINGAQRSAFVQHGQRDPRNSAAIQGGVTSAGAVNHGTGFLAQRLGVGHFKLFWDIPFVTTPTIVFGTDQGAPLLGYWTGNILGTGGGGPDIFITTPAGALVDYFWTFICMSISAW